MENYLQGVLGSEWVGGEEWALQVEESNKGNRVRHLQPTATHNLVATQGLVLALQHQGEKQGELSFRLNFKDC